MGFCNSMRRIDKQDRLGGNVGVSVVLTFQGLPRMFLARLVNLSLPCVGSGRLAEEERRGGNGSDDTVEGGFCVCSF